MIFSGNNKDLANLVQIIFVFVCFSFTQGNHHDFVFAEEEPVEQKIQTESLLGGPELT